MVFTYAFHLYPCLLSGLSLLEIEGFHEAVSVKLFFKYIEPFDFGENGKEITLMENEDAIRRLRNTMILAVAIGFLGIVSIHIIAQKIS